MFDRFFRKLSAVVHHKAAPYAASANSSWSIAPSKVTPGTGSRRWRRRCSLPPTNSALTEGFKQTRKRSRPRQTACSSFGRIFTGLVIAKSTERALCASRHNGWPSLAVCMCLPSALGLFPAWSMTSLSGWRRSEDFRRKRSRIAAGMSSASSRGSMSTVATSWI
jgi:hypothetical protein